MEDRITRLEQDMKEHYHDGILGAEIDASDLVGLFKTVTETSELNAILLSTPKRVTEQVFIDTTTGTKKLYIYDAVGYVWYNVTLTI